MTLLNDEYIPPDSFWEALDTLVEQHTIMIDRPKGSAHPRYPTLVYPLDYGFLVGTHADDGDGIDVWLGSLPERHVVAIIVTVDLLKKEVEIKLLLGCNAEERLFALHMH
jgi:inorganic pyrophosphatase